MDGASSAYAATQHAPALELEDVADFRRSHPLRVETDLERRLDAHRVPSHDVPRTARGPDPKAEKDTAPLARPLSVALATRGSSELNLVTYHGVLAPAAGFRDRIVPVTLSRQAACEPKETKTGKPKPAKKTAKALRRYSWPEVMKRVFEIDVLQCPCGARRAIIAFLTDPEVVHGILECLGLPTAAPDIAPARPPPQAEFVFECQA